MNCEAANSAWRCNEVSTVELIFNYSEHLGNKSVHATISLVSRLPSLSLIPKDVPSPYTCLKKQLSSKKKC